MKINKGDQKLQPQPPSAATAYANAVSVSSKSAKAHYKLGVVMEELFFLEDLMGNNISVNCDVSLKLDI